MMGSGWFDPEEARAHAQAKARFAAGERAAAKAARRLKAGFPPAQISDPAMDRAVDLISLQCGAGRTHKNSLGGYRLILKAKLVHSGLAAGGSPVECRAIQITAHYQGPDESGVGDGESCETCINGIFQDFLHLVVGASDGRERPGRTPPLTEPRGRGGFFRRLIRYLNNCLLGDALGAAALAILLVAALWLPEVLS